MVRGLATMLSAVLVAGCSWPSAEPAPQKPASGRTKAPAEKIAVPSQESSLGDEFCLTSNPGGDWSWGQSDPKGRLGSFDLFAGHGRLAEVDVPIWTVDGGDQKHDPCIWRSTLDYTLAGVKPREVAFHPGPDRRLAVVRWTAPRAGVVTVDGYFGAGDLGKVDVYVIKTDGGGAAVEVLFRVLNTPSDQLFRLSTTVRAGETIDFAVGNAGAWDYDTTPLVATIVLEPDREPATASKSK